MSDAVAVASFSQNVFLGKKILCSMPAHPHFVVCAVVDDGHEQNRQRSTDLKEKEIRSAVA